MYIFIFRQLLIHGFVGLASGGSMVARLDFEGIDGRAPPGVEPAAEFDSARRNFPGPDMVRIDICVVRYPGHVR